jgi:two-component system phosphate regulon sensor histidine kinase PhoR
MMSTDDADKRAMESSSVMAARLDRALAELSDERSLLEAVLEGMADSVLALDTDLGFRLMNRATRNLLGCGVIAPGTSLRELIGEERMVDVQRMSQSEQDGKIARLEWLWNSDGMERILLVNLFPMQDEEGWILVLRDVTEIRRLERIRQDFVANVSHELRTPISVIQANAQTLLAGADSDLEFASVLTSAIDRNAQRLSAIIAHLLELSQLEAERERMVVEPLNLVSVVHDAVSSVQGLIGEKHSKVDILVDSKITVLANRQALQQVILNLLENAVNYNGEQTTIWIRSRTNDATVRLEVEDNGIGIEEQHRSRIFERFYRVDKGRSRKMGGTGLGLALVRHLTEKMGGEVGLE